jgi:hypothetical protein
VNFRKEFPLLVSIELKGSEWVEFLAYLDSGASYTIFHSDVLKVLNLQPLKERKEFITVGDGSLITVSFYRIPVAF